MILQSNRENRTRHLTSMGPLISHLPRLSDSIQSQFKILIPSMDSGPEVIPPSLLLNQETVFIEHYSFALQ